jgi:excinuclease UvrABC ATPase subunit
VSTPTSRRWAKAHGHTHLRVDGEFLPTSPWPRLDRFKEHTIELPIRDFVVSERDEKTLRDAVRESLEHGKGVLHLLAPLDGWASRTRRRRRSRCIRPSAPARAAAPASPSSTRGCSRSTRNTAGVRSAWARA